MRHELLPLKNCYSPSGQGHSKSVPFISVHFCSFSDRHFDILTILRSEKFPFFQKKRAFPYENVVSVFVAGYLISGSENKEAPSSFFCEKTNRKAPSGLLRQVHIYALGKGSNYKMQYLKHHQARKTPSPLRSIEACYIVT